jgi:Amidohydrolase
MRDGWNRSPRDRASATGSWGGAIWIHPTRSEVWADCPVESRSRCGIWWSLGWPYETSVCMARLVYSGFFDRHPGLTVITHHAGAMVPHFARAPGLPAGGSRPRGHHVGTEAEPIDYFRRFFADTAMFGAAHAVRCAVEFFGTDHVLFGTDLAIGVAAGGSSSPADCASRRVSD